MESLVTLMLCLAEASFVISIYRFCALGLDPAVIGFDNGTFSPSDGTALVWMLIRSVFDIFMGFRYLIGYIRKVEAQSYNDWIRYGLVTISVNLFFAVLLIYHDKRWEIETISLGIDSLIKFFIVVIINNLKASRKTIPVAQLEKKPLLA